MSYKGITELETVPKPKDRQPRLRPPIPAPNGGRLRQLHRAQPEGGPEGHGTGAGRRRRYSGAPSRSPPPTPRLAAKRPQRHGQGHSGLCLLRAGLLETRVQVHPETERFVHELE